MKSLKILRKFSRRSNVTKPLRECSCEQISKRQRRGNLQRRRQIRSSFVQRLSSPISPPKWRMTGGNLAQAYGVTTKLVHPLLARIWSSPRSRQGICANWRTKRWRRSKFRCARHSERFSRWFFHHLRQCSHGWRTNCPASFSPRRPPRRSRRGMQEKALNRALREASNKRQQARQKNFEVKFGVNISVFYYLQVLLGL